MFTSTNYSSSSSSSHHTSMEHVWNDITFSSLPSTKNNNNNNNNNININTNNNNNNNSHIVVHHPTPNTNFRGMILQDFLNCNNPPSITALDSHHHHHDDQQPKTALKLTKNFSAFDLLASSSMLANFGGGGGGSGGGGGDGDGDVVVRKRSLDSTPENANVDRRHKRMIKNRDSAARSRARKQAYIMKLQLEVAHLAAENTRLRKQQQQLLEAPSSEVVPEKKGLHRTLTAPF